MGTSYILHYLAGWITYDTKNSHQAKQNSCNSKQVLLHYIGKYKHHIKWTIDEGKVPNLYIENRIGWCVL